jgi:hypothetical protein
MWVKDEAIKYAVDLHSCVRFYVVHGDRFRDLSVTSLCAEIVYFMGQRVASTIAAGRIM